MRCLFWTVVLLACVLLSIRIIGEAIAWRYMADYNRLVSRRVTSAEAVRELGTPWEVITNERQFRESMADFRPRGGTPRYTGNKVLKYAADPWGDGEGAVVYLFFDAKDRLQRADIGL